MIMEVIINNKPYTVSDGNTIMDIFSIIEITSMEGIAIGLNQNIISKENWDNTKLKDGDRILIIRASRRHPFILRKPWK